MRKNNHFKWAVLFWFLCVFRVAFAFDEKEMPGASYRGGLPVNQLPATSLPASLQGVTIEEHLGSFINLDLSFRNEQGEIVTMRQMLGGKPLLLTMNYFRCESLCGLQLDHLAHVMNAVDWTLGKEFNMASISFDQTDTTDLALGMYNKYAVFLNQKKAPWHFYTASLPVIQTLTNELGFYYKYDTASRSFAHAAAVFFISPTGKLVRYLYGVSYNPRDIKFALIDASVEKIGSTVDRVLLTCFHYNATNGQYDAVAYTALRIAAVITVLVLGGILIFLFYRDRSKKRR